MGAVRQLSERNGPGSHNRPSSSSRVQSSLFAVTAGHPYDVAVLGGGMAGITGALAAQARGAKVVLFEPGPIGGT